MEQTWYEKQFETANLSADDASWLAQLADVPTDTITEQWLEQGNCDVSKGSIHLTGNTDPETHASVMAARYAFFGQTLGWDQPSHPLYASYNKKWSNKNGISHNCTTPLATTIASLRILDAYKLSSVKIVNATPSVLSMNPNSVAVKLDNLNNQGLDVVKVVNALPTILNLNPESVTAKMDNLRSHGLDAVKVVNAMPAILGFNPDSVTAKMDNLRRLAAALGWQGSLVDLIHYQPGLLSYKPQKLRSLARFVADHGDSDWRQASIAEVASATIRPIDSHLATIALGDYQTKHVQAEQTRTPAVERRDRSLELIKDPPTAAKLGKKTIAAYLRYAPLESKNVTSAI